VKFCKVRVCLSNLPPFSNNPERTFRIPNICYHQPGSELCLWIPIIPWVCLNVECKTGRVGDHRIWLKPCNNVKTTRQSSPPKRGWDLATRPPGSLDKVGLYQGVLWFFLWVNCRACYKVGSSSSCKKGRTIRLKIVSWSLVKEGEDSKIIKKFPQYSKR